MTAKQKKPNVAPVIRVRRRPVSQCGRDQSINFMGILDVTGRQIYCAMGRSGTTSRKREGDGKTPIGRFAVVEVYHRVGRTKRPATNLPIASIKPEMGWCDDPNDRNYNRRVKLPYRGSHEYLWRQDHLYDVIVVLDQNYSQRMRNRGSAIFLHLAHDDYRGTEGCIAIAHQHMRRLTSFVRRGTIIEISN